MVSLKSKYEGVQRYPQEEVSQNAILRVDYILKYILIILIPLNISIYIIITLCILPFYNSYISPS